MNATLHGNTSEKLKTSATLHVNASSPDWSPKMGPLKTLQTIYVKMFLDIFGVRPEHPLCAHQKMDHPKWTPKSAQGDRTKHLFSYCFLLILFFGLLLVTAPGVPFIFKKSNIALVFIHFFDALIESMLDHPRANPKSQKTSATLHGNAPAKNETSAALHGNAFRAFMVQLGASKSSPGDRT